MLWQLLQRVRAAAPRLALHLFRSASDRMVCSFDSSSSRPYDPDKPRGQGAMDAAAVAHISAYVDEVGRWGGGCPVFFGGGGAFGDGSWLCWLLTATRSCAVENMQTVTPAATAAATGFRSVW